jgi:DNA-binding transcriptional ArsR family regulator
MDLSPVKFEILEALLFYEKPVKAAQVAKDIGKEIPSVQMHLIGLTKMGFAESPLKGQYLISKNGRKTVGLNEITKEKALAILSQTPRERAFHFYTEIGKPLNIYAHDLLEFCDRIGKVSVDSIEFHLKRGDFEAWFKSMGDLELAKKTTLLKERKFNAEEMRFRLHSIIENRCLDLSKIVG